MNNDTTTTTTKEHTMHTMNTTPTKEHTMPTTRDVVCVGMDGRSRPILRYADQLHLPEWERDSVPTTTTVDPAAVEEALLVWDACYGGKGGPIDAECDAFTCDELGAIAADFDVDPVALAQAVYAERGVR